MSASPTPVALTMGDPAGVGGEIAAKAWARRDPAAPFFMIADADWPNAFERPLPAKSQISPRRGAMVSPKSKSFASLGRS